MYNTIVESKEYQTRLLTLLKKYRFLHADDSWYSDDPEYAYICPLIFDYFEYLLSIGYERDFIGSEPFESYTLNRLVEIDGYVLKIREIYGQGSDVIIELDA